MNPKRSKTHRMCSSPATFMQPQPARPHRRHFVRRYRHYVIVPSPRDPSSAEQCDPTHPAT